MKINITEKDGKKYIDEKVLLNIQYSLFGKTLLVLFSLFGLLVAILLQISENTYILLKVFGFLIFIQSLWLFLDVLLFKEMKITKDMVTKIWLLGEISIPVNKINYAYRSFYKLNRGKIVFQSFQSKKRNFFLHNIMAIHLLGLSNYEQTLLNMKKVFTKLNIIKGDENEWNY